MAQNKSLKQLSKFLDFVLGRRPDEFGLVTDSKGFVKIKELLKAITEEKGWKYVRRSHLDEILYSLPNPPFEISDNLIRANHRNHLPRQTSAQDLPKLLYTGIRKRAYAFVLDKGIFPTGYPQIILASSPDLAERMGKRIDQSPVVLTVQVQKSVENGVIFRQAGEKLYLAEYIPTGCFSGPSQPKETTPKKRQAAPEKALQPKLAGSFLIDLDEKIHPQPPKRKKKNKEIDWKADRKRMKKHKRKREQPPWRK